MKNHLKIEKANIHLHKLGLVITNLQLMILKKGI
jgi:hypothetical protein